MENWKTSPDFGMQLKTRYFDAYTDRDLIGVFLTTLTKDRYVDSMVIPGNENPEPANRYCISGLTLIASTVETYENVSNFATGYKCWWQT